MLHNKSFKFSKHEGSIEIIHESVSYGDRSLWEGFVTKPPPYSLGLYQWSNKVVHKAVRLWDIRGGKMLRHAVHLLVTPRVVVSLHFLSSFVIPRLPGHS